MKKTALIFGVTGMDGSYLSELLLSKDYIVYGVIRRSSHFNTHRIDHLMNGKNDNFITMYGDVTDTSSVNDLIRNFKPDEIYNLAAQSHVMTSFEIPLYTSQVDAIGTLNILEAIRQNSPNSKFYQASTSELFGKVVETPQSETTPFYPRSPYACAKAYSYYLTKNYRESYNIFASNGILFNHESERRTETFITRKITRFLTRYKAGFRDDVLKLGNIDSQRDWGYAPEYVKGMWKMLQHYEPDDFVLATGETNSVKDFLELCLIYLDIPYYNGSKYYSNFNNGNIIVEFNNNQYKRPAEVDLLQGNATKAKRLLNWEAKTKLPELVKIMCNADLKLAEREFYAEK